MTTDTLSKNFKIEIVDKIQVVDLNSDKTSFNVNFKIETDNREPFQGLVLAKSELDKYEKLDNIKLKQCPGILKGKVDTNTLSEKDFETFFVLLKTIEGNNSIKATVDIDLSEYKKTEETNEEVEAFAESRQGSLSTSKEEPFSLRSFIGQSLDKFFVHILVVLLGSLGLYYFFKYNKTKSLTTHTKTEPPLSLTESEETILPTTTTEENSLQHNQPKEILVNNEIIPESIVATSQPFQKSNEKAINYLEELEK